jgi:transcriptional antiterminator RfaH
LKTSFQENHLNPELPRWFAVRVGFRKEKVVHSDFQKLGIETYLPLRTSVRIYNRKRKVVVLPLMPMYLFVKIKSEDYLKVISHNYILGFVKCGSVISSIPESEIITIRKVLGDYPNAEAVESNHFSLGDRVELIGGNLMGMLGVIYDQEDEKKVLIELKTIGIGLIIEVPREMLLKLSKVS